MKSWVQAIEALPLPIAKTNNAHITVLLSEIVRDTILSHVQSVAGSRPDGDATGACERGRRGMDNDSIF